jgi:hypothetical protein
MPWKVSGIVDQRLQFLSSYQKEEMSVSDLCHEFGVSRPTGYRWINRYKEVGPEGLLDLSRRPHGCSHATPDEIANAILVLRAKHPFWERGSLRDGSTNRKIHFLPDHCLGLHGSVPVATTLQPGSTLWGFHGRKSLTGSGEAQISQALRDR